MINFTYDLFKVSKMTILVVTCSKSAIVVKKQDNPRDFLKARFVKKGYTEIIEYCV